MGAFFATPCSCLYIKLSISDISLMVGTYLSYNLCLLFADKPTVTIKKSDIRRAHGGYVTLECIVGSYPRSRYEWRKEDQPIPEPQGKISNNGTSTR